MPSANPKLEKQASTETAEPIRQAIVVIEHKIRNLEKRKVSLDHGMCRDHGRKFNLSATARFSTHTVRSAMIHDAPCARNFLKVLPTRWDCSVSMYVSCAHVCSTMRRRRVPTYAVLVRPGDVERANLSSPTLYHGGVSSTCMKLLSFMYDALYNWRSDRTANIAGSRTASADRLTTNNVTMLRCTQLAFGVLLFCPSLLARLWQMLTDDAVENDDDESSHDASYRLRECHEIVFQIGNEVTHRVWIFGVSYRCISRLDKVAYNCSVKHVVLSYLGVIQLHEYTKHVACTVVHLLKNSTQTIQVSMLFCEFRVG